MNVPSDAMRLVPYLNREQYGERPLLKGPAYNASPVKVDREDRYGIVGDRYEVVDESFDVIYNDKDMMMFPRIGHSDQGRQQLHRIWKQQLTGKGEGKPTMSYNLSFMTSYQITWMYARYFMWNFVGKQNGDQGYFPWDLRTGHWQSGIKVFDEAKLYNMDKLTDTMKADPSNNKYYFLPLIFGILGLVFHFFGSRKDFLTLFMLFLITGIGIIIYSNQPPNEPRERDYVLVGSFMIFCVWIGMGVLALYDVLKDKVGKNGIVGAALASGLVLTAPIIMGFQNFDDHSRADHTAGRDYAANFLNSLEDNAIIFTYGDNDTYPLWYAQEIEGIRTDVRVVNLSLIQVDWYIEKLRKKVNDSEAIKITIPQEQLRGRLRNQVWYTQQATENQQLELGQALNLIGRPDNLQQGRTLIPARKFYMSIDSARVANSPIFNSIKGLPIDKTINLSFPASPGYLTKDDLAVMDIIYSNFYDRPIYFAVTCQESKLLKLNDNTQLEGLALRVVPVETKSTTSLGIYGSGRVEADIIYNNVMNKWAWGGFDKHDTYVNDSYKPGVNAMKMAILRAATKYVESGNKARGNELANKAFEAFPHNNFPYSNSTINFINVLVQGDDFESAKKHSRIFAEETRQNLEFYQSLDQDDFGSFQTNYEDAIQAANYILLIARSVEDPAFEKEMKDMLESYTTAPQQILD